MFERLERSTKQFSLLWGHCKVRTDLFQSGDGQRKQTSIKPSWSKKGVHGKLCNLSSNAKKFWSTMKKLNNSPSSIPTLLHNNCTASSDKEKASMLNQFFSNCFNWSEPHLMPQILTRCEYILTYAPLNFSALRRRYWNCCKAWTLIRHQDQMV